MATKKHLTGCTVAHQLKGIDNLVSVDPVQRIPAVEIENHDLPGTDPENLARLKAAVVDEQDLVRMPECRSQFCQRPQIASADVILRDVMATLLYPAPHALDVQFDGSRAT